MAHAKRLFSIPGTAQSEMELKLLLEVLAFSIEMRDEREIAAGITHGCFVFLFQVNHG